ncbi:MAG TPA: type IV pilus modification protein PilV [Gammaproteobacteria bacterium]
MTATPKINKGSSMIEVLIAVLVLSIGLLGLAGLQASSLQYTHDAHTRTTAAILAYDLIERIHVNDESAADYTSGDSCDNQESCCSAATVSVDNDLMCWTLALQQQLPNGAGSVTGPDANGFYTLNISWLERESGQTFTQSWVFLP